MWGSGNVEGVAITEGGVVIAGGFGVKRGDERLDGLPSLGATALALWRGRPVVALASGGLFRRDGDRWLEISTGWGRLHVRALSESPAGELYAGAQEGLFRAAWGAATMDRLLDRPVRSIAFGPGFALAGGESGLFRVEPSVTTVVATPDPWIESVAIDNDDLFVVTATGLARGAISGPLAPVGGSADVLNGVAVHDRYFAIGAAPSRAVRIFGPGKTIEELLPARPRKLIAASGQLFADTDLGLYRRTGDGWRMAAPRPDSSLPGSGHVGAIASMGGSLLVGMFDGGLAVSETSGAALAFRAVDGSSAWGVNAIEAAGGTIHVASLRGLCAYDGHKLVPEDGAGAAFALAATPRGMAAGCGSGLLLPSGRLISAFHGLPGNQVQALAAGTLLYAGTPSGLGAVDVSDPNGARVRWRMTQGDGKLPHPWVTALARTGDALWIGTYGGGVARLPLGPRADTRDPGTPERYPETYGLKVNPGCVMAVAGAIYAGSDDRGLFCLERGASRFEPVRVPLPSARITALHATSDALWVGTDQGLARLPLAFRDGREGDAL